MEYSDFIRAELLALIPFLYILGMFLKQAAFIADRFIPLILGAVGVLLAVCYLAGDTEAFGLTAAATAVVQGVLCTGAAVYGNQVFKQLTKGKEEKEDGK